MSKLSKRDYHNAALKLDGLRCEISLLLEKFKVDPESWGAISSMDWASHQMLLASDWFFKLRRKTNVPKD